MSWQPEVTCCWLSRSFLQAEALVRLWWEVFTPSTGRMGCPLTETTGFADLRWSTIDVCECNGDAVSDSPSLAGWIFPPSNNHPLYSQGAIKGQGSEHKAMAIYGHAAFKWELSHKVSGIWMLVPQLVALFRKVWEGVALLAAVCYWRWDLRVWSLALIPVISALSSRVRTEVLGFMFQLPRLPLTATPSHMMDSGSRKL